MKIEAIPVWAMRYIYRGDSTGLTEEVENMIDEAMEGVMMVEPILNKDLTVDKYFCDHPFFGKPCVVVDCELTYFD